MWRFMLHRAVRGATNMGSTTARLYSQEGKNIGMSLLGKDVSSKTLGIVGMGRVVDQEALVEALENKTIQAAALDVTYPEPLPRDHPLLSLPNVIVLPHMGTDTVETTRKIIKKMIANALAVLAGETPPNEVIV
ncbi:hypothetical protein CRUP_017064 [Coryphaenoides rupestris]|nr:hypothetical protein CRUP_017064 [Coryphaenoides rupestris]